MTGVFLTHYSLEDCLSRKGGQEHILRYHQEKNWNGRACFHLILGRLQLIPLLSQIVYVVEAIAFHFFSSLNLISSTSKPVTSQASYFKAQQTHSLKQQTIKWGPLVEARQAISDDRIIVHDQHAITVILDAHASQNYEGARDRNAGDALSAGSACTLRCFYALNYFLQEKNFNLFLNLIAQGDLKQLTAWQYMMVLGGMNIFTEDQQNLLRLREAVGTEQKRRSQQHQTHASYNVANEFNLGQNRIGIKDCFFTGRGSIDDGTNSEKNQLATYLKKTHFPHVEMDFYTEQTATNLAKFYVKKIESNPARITGALFTNQQGMTYVLIYSKDANCSILIDPHRNTITVLANANLEESIKESFWRCRDRQVKTKQDLKTPAVREEADTTRLIPRNLLGKPEYDFLGKPYFSPMECNILDMAEMVFCTPSATSV